MQPLDIFSYLGKLQDYYARERIIPSTTQLSALWNVKARSWTHQIVQRLKEEDFLEVAAGSRLRPGPRFFERTVGHAVRAGLPQQASDVQPELLRIDDYLIEKTLTNHSLSRQRRLDDRFGNSRGRHGDYRTQQFSLSRTGRAGNRG